MTEFVFVLENGRALPVREPQLVCNAARFCLQSGKAGVLVIGDMRYPFGKEGATVSANALQSGLHTPAFFVEGARYEAPPMLAYGGTLLFLPPSRAEAYALQKQLQALTAQLQSLQSRLDALDAQLATNHIF